MKKLLCALMVVFGACTSPAFDGDPPADVSAAVQLIKTGPTDPDPSEPQVSEMQDQLDEMMTKAGYGGAETNTYCTNMPWEHGGGVTCCSFSEPLVGDGDETDSGGAIDNRFMCCVTSGGSAWCGQVPLAPDENVSAPEPAKNVEAAAQSRAVVVPKELTPAPQTVQICAPWTCTFMTAWLCDTFCGGPSYCRIKDYDAQVGKCIGLTDLP